AHLLSAGRVAPARVLGGRGGRLGGLGAAGRVLNHAMTAIAAPRARPVVGYGVLVGGRLGAASGRVQASDSHQAGDKPLDLAACLLGGGDVGAGEVLRPLDPGRFGAGVVGDGRAVGGGASVLHRLPVARLAHRPRVTRLGDDRRGLVTEGRAVVRVRQVDDVRLAARQAVHAVVHRSERGGDAAVD